MVEPAKKNELVFPLLKKGRNRAPAKNKGVSSEKEKANKVVCAFFLSVLKRDKVRSYKEGKMDERNEPTPVIIYGCKAVEKENARALSFPFHRKERRKLELEARESINSRSHPVWNREKGRERTSFHSDRRRKEEIVGNNL